MGSIALGQQNYPVKVRWRDEQQPLMDSLRSLKHLQKLQDEEYKELLPEDVHETNKLIGKEMAQYFKLRDNGRPKLSGPK